MMSPLFRRSEEKEARRAAAKVEIERLRALPAGELAAMLLPALGPDGPSRGASVREQQLCEHLLRDHPGAGQLATLDLLPAVRRGLELLHDERLVSAISYQRSPIWKITPQGLARLSKSPGTPAS